MSYDGDTMLDDCGAVHPLTGDQCSLPTIPHDRHAGNGRTWRQQATEVGAERRQEFREISSQDPAVVEAFGFGLFLVGARLGTADPDAGTDARAVELWRGSRPEDRAHWLHRAAGVIDAALSYVP